MGFSHRHQINVPLITRASYDGSPDRAGEAVLLATVLVFIKSVYTAATA